MKAIFQKKITWFGLTLILVLALLFLLHRPLLSRYARFFIYQSDRNQAADAVVVLSGGSGERVLAGIQRFQVGNVKKLVVCSWKRHLLGSEQQQGEYAKEEAITRGVPATAIMLPAAKTSTYAEARLVQTLARQENWQTVVVISGPFHSRRTRFIFNKVFADDPVKILILPASKKEALAWSDHWWQSERQFLRVFTETLKLPYYFWKYRQLNKVDEAKKEGAASALAP